MNREIIKPLLLITAFTVCVVIEHLPFGAAVMLSVIHLGGLALCGELARVLARLPAYQSIHDRFVVNYLLGWCFTPVLAIFAYLFGSIGIVVGWLTVICGVFVASKRIGGMKSPIVISESIPISLYVVAVIFTIISVAVPFSCFSGSSILREFYGDAVQRFGVIYALSKDVPPHNPFFAGAPMRYYWLWMLPYAQEYKYIHNDLFNVWKCGQTWSALCFPLGLWYLLKNQLNCRKAASIAVLFVLVFTSYKVFAHPVLLQKTAGIFGIHYDIHTYDSNITDPDFTIGVLQPYSDQLLTEDFLYIPQNTYAIVIVLTALATLAGGSVVTGGVILSTLVGVNAFFALPAFTAYLVICTALCGWRKGVTAICAIAIGSSICMAMCGITETRVIMLTAVGFTIIGFLVSANNAYKTQTGISERTTQYWAIAMLLSFACIVALSPLHNTTALTLGYSPSILFGIYYIVQLVKKRDKGTPLTVFLLIFVTVYALSTTFISFQHIPAAPGWLRNAAVYIGQEMNLFNFYHKSGKMVRLAWAVFGALGVNVLLPYMQRIATKQRLLVVLGSTCLFLSAITALLRPFTYLGHAPVAESDAAAYLKIAAKNDTVLLLDDYKTSEINELAPVQVFYYSQWSNGNGGLNTLSGTWADQYLPVEMRYMSLRRKQQVDDFFISTDNVYKMAFLKNNHISFVLTRKPYVLTGIADLVISKPGGYLYRIHHD